MEPNEFLSPRDVALTAAVVVPATLLWIATERLWPAIALASTVYLGVEYGYPAFRARKFDFQPLVSSIVNSAIRAYEYARTLIRSRVARGA